MSRRPRPLSYAARRQRRETAAGVAMIAAVLALAAVMVWACIKVDASRGITVAQSLDSAGF